jgi:hypothetical protein
MICVRRDGKEGLILSTGFCVRGSGVRNRPTFANSETFYSGFVEACGRGVAAGVPISSFVHRGETFSPKAHTYDSLSCEIV